MRPGPRPTPTRLRVLKGETKPSRVNPNEPQVADGEIDPILQLSAPGRAVFDALVAKMAGSKILTPVDGPLLGVFAELLVEAHEMTWHLRVTSAKEEAAYMVNGQRLAERVKNPLVGMIRQHRSLLRAYAQEYGLTPASRVGLVVAQDAPSDLESLLS
jgi:P27 family predicted phage terminase small subunit